MIENIGRKILDGSTIAQSLPCVRWVHLVGSAAYLPDLARDIDFAVCINPKADPIAYVHGLRADGWEPCGEDAYDMAPGPWMSCRRGEYNLMITNDFDWYGRYVRAMEVCKALKLTDRNQRIAVCKIVRDGASAVDVLGLISVPAVPPQ